MDNKYNINLEENNSCSCGGGCCGGHSHDENSHSCCSGHNHQEHGHSCCCTAQLKTDDLTEDETAFLNHLLSYTYLPVTRFLLKSTKESSFVVNSLSPVYIEYKDDSMDKVKFISEILNSLEEKGIISIDYDIKLKNYDYSEYFESDLYNYFVKTVEESKNQKDFLGDTTDLETGSMALTDQYLKLISK